MHQNEKIEFFFSFLPLSVSGIPSRNGHPGCRVAPSFGQKSTLPVAIGCPYKPASVWIISTKSASQCDKCCNRIGGKNGGFAGSNPVILASSKQH